MRVRLKKIQLLALFFLSAAVAHSNTFLIGTRDSESREEMSVKEKIRIVSIESGIMDYLFEGGHIFFNMFLVSSEDRKNPSFDEMIGKARKEGVDYFIELSKEEKGATWKLYRTRDKKLEIEGFEKVSSGSNKNEKERWLDVGNTIGRRILSYI